ncbi:CoA pyrophosphatase [Putridiphycobacter roseus]|uniref:CoA pyrophosphatase n=1 Tax=Putridiphycobacter roseus TaxID=2219161 RepID=A0A2W1NCJ6_9FLAO|nr:CoA pyrophosphatase [Putridiphycobacter roseus]PZE16803.1 CoA pyrophosphatase [Putridiphycobacter roseus]
MESLIKTGAIYEIIKQELLTLPGESAHKEMVPFRTLSSIAKPGKNAKESAVLCLLSTYQDDITITLMERTKDSSPHSGQISLPGGKKENFDLNLAATALRETEEEIGILPRNVSILGKLTPIYIPVSNFSVQPFIGQVKTETPFILSEKEVQSVFKITVRDLLNPRNNIKKDIPNHLGQTLKNVPCFFINDRIIWGATSIILNEFKVVIENIIAKKNTH